MAAIQACSVLRRAMVCRNDCVRGSRIIVSMRPALLPATWAVRNFLPSVGSSWARWGTARQKSQRTSSTFTVDAMDQRGSRAIAREVPFGHAVRLDFDHTLAPAHPKGTRMIRSELSFYRFDLLRPESKTRRGTPRSATKVRRPCFCRLPTSGSAACLMDLFCCPHESNSRHEYRVRGEPRAARPE